jgi:phage gpG-like protein
MAYAIILAKQTEAALMAMVPRQAAATKAATSKSLHLIEKAIKEKLSTSGSVTNPGRATNGRFQKNIYASSPPGEPPYLRTGALRRSVQVDGPHPTGPTSVEGQVGPTIVYARIQELGGVAGHSTLPARPYAQPAFEEVMPEIGVIYREAWAAALRDIGI